MILAAPYLVFATAVGARIFREPRTRLSQIVQQCADQQQARVRACWRWRSASAGAYAQPAWRHIIFTERALEILNDEELAAACHHEIAHLQEPWSFKFFAILYPLHLLGWIFIRPILIHWPGALILLCAIPVIVRRLWTTQQWRIETRADFIAIQHSPQGAFAMALLKTCWATFTPAVLSFGRQTHPDIYDRVLRAGVTPDFPRPAPAQPMTSLGALCMCLAIGFVIAALAHYFKNSVS